MDRITSDADNLNRHPGEGRLWLLAIGGLLVLAGAGLALTAGPPRLPAEPPALDQIVPVLTGTRLPLDGLALLLVDVAWLVWGWTALSLVLELLVLAAELVAR